MATNLWPISCTGTVARSQTLITIDCARIPDMWSDTVPFSDTKCLSLKILATPWRTPSRSSTRCGDFRGPHAHRCSPVSYIQEDKSKDFEALQHKSQLPLVSTSVFLPIFEILFQRLHNVSKDGTGMLPFDYSHLCLVSRTCTQPI